MRSANGPDIAAVYRLLTQVTQTVTGHDRKLDALSADMASFAKPWPDATASSTISPPGWLRCARR